MSGATFPKSERIKSKQVLEHLFEKGGTLKKYPFLVKHISYTFVDGEQLKVAFSVPKRKVKKAASRNRLRRQIKEAYRLNKSDLKNVLIEADKGLALFFIYTGEENADYSKLEEKIKVILKQLIQNYGPVVESVQE